MLRLTAVAGLIVAIGLAQPALAAPPPQDAQPLSQILQSLEQKGDIAYFDEVDWDDDDGYWEIEYISGSGVRAKIRVDPVTGMIKK